MPATLRNRKGAAKKQADDASAAAAELAASGKGGGPSEPTPPFVASLSTTGYTKSSFHLSRPVFGWALDTPVSPLARMSYYMCIFFLTFFDHLSYWWAIIVENALGKTEGEFEVQHWTTAGKNVPYFPSLFSDSFKEITGLNYLYSTLVKQLGGDWWAPRASQMGQMTGHEWCTSHDELLWLGGGLGPANKLLRYLIPQDSTCADKLVYADTALFWSLSVAIITAGAIVAAEWKWPGWASRASVDRSGRGWAVWLVCRIPPIMTMCSFSLLEVTFQMVRDSNHRWSLPAVCIIFLALDNPLVPSVFIREQIITVSAWILAGAGYSKIHVTPNHPTDPAVYLTTTWMQGDTLRWHIGNAFITNEEARQTWTLRAFLHLRQWTIPILASSTVLIELMGFFLLFRCFVPRSRWWVVACLYFCTVAWSGMHLGILFTMGIRYQPQMMSYWTLLLPWSPPKLTHITERQDQSNASTSFTEDDGDDDGNDSMTTKKGTKNCGSGGGGTKNKSNNNNNSIV